MGVLRRTSEDGVGIDLSRVCERNRGDRTDPKRKANRYLKYIHRRLHEPARIFLPSGSEKVLVHLGC
jgi:hypothetical protein